jgi:hypothetical protein
VVIPEAKAGEHWCPFMNCACLGKMCMAWEWAPTIRGGEDMPTDLTFAQDREKWREWRCKPFTHGYCRRFEERK